MSDPRLSIGGNNPPTPFDEASQRVDGVWTEAQHWLDGGVVGTQAEADAIGKLLDLARKAKKEADDARKAEAKPFDDGKKEVQARYRPLLDRCDRIADAAKKALAPFLAAQEEAKRREAEKAREEARLAEEKARQAAMVARDLASADEAERLAQEAKVADMAALRAAKDKAGATGGARKVTLRTQAYAEITDLTAALKWIWANDVSALRGFAQQYADGALRAGQPLPPGVERREEKVAV